MRKTPITQGEFEKRFWVGGFDHRALCTVFGDIDLHKEFKAFWREVNVDKWGFACLYFHPGEVGLEEKAMLRLMIAQEFIKQFNESLKEKDNE